MLNNITLQFASTGMPKTQLAVDAARRVAPEHSMADLQELPSAPKTPLAIIIRRQPDLRARAITAAHLAVRPLPGAGCSYSDIAHRLPR